MTEPGEIVRKRFPEYLATEPPITRDEMRAIVRAALLEHEAAKASHKRKRKPKPEDTTAFLEREVVAKEPTPIYALSTVWLDCIGAINVGRIGKALNPLLTVYEPKWIEAGIRAYAAELHRDGKMKYGSPENFAGRATGYILPALPANELTEREAELIGMTESRNHMDTLGLLTDRARG